jgi:hypothetical protein
MINLKFWTNTFFQVSLMDPAAVLCTILLLTSRFVQWEQKVDRKLYSRVSCSVSSGLKDHTNFEDGCLLGYSSPWSWRQQTLLKRRWTSTSLHGGATRKTAIFVIISLRTRNITYCFRYPFSFKFICTVVKTVILFWNNLHYFWFFWCHNSAFTFLYSCRLITRRMLKSGNEFRRPSVQNICVYSLICSLSSLFQFSFRLDCSRSSTVKMMHGMKN